METETKPSTGNDINENESSSQIDDTGIYLKEKFDKKKFLTILISGIVSSILGVSVISSSMNISSKFSASPGIHTISNIVSESPKELLIFLGGNLLLLTGVYCIFLGLKIVVRYIAGNLKN